MPRRGFIGKNGTVGKVVGDPALSPRQYPTAAPQQQPAPPAPTAPSPRPSVALAPFSSGPMQSLRRQVSAPQAKQASPRPMMQPPLQAAPIAPTPEAVAELPEPTLFDIGLPATANPKLSRRSPAPEHLLDALKRKFIY